MSLVDDIECEQFLRDKGLISNPGDLVNYQTVCAGFDRRISGMVNYAMFGSFTSIPRSTPDISSWQHLMVSIFLKYSSRRRKQGLRK